MSEGFKGFVPKEDDKVRLHVNNSEVQKLIKEYKRIKKLQKSNMFEVSKLSGKETEVDRLLRKYGIDSEAIE
tara:strand:- start:299 stop:514 length:216 start_codon:yes stop_codon:yes gene_type:complete